MDSSLTGEVLSYQRTRVGLAPLIARISLFVYRYPRFRLGWDEDSCSEFFCFFYPKLLRIVDRFRYQGRPFEVYLLTSLKWQLRTYAGQEASRELRRRLLSHDALWAWETPAAQPPAEPEGSPGAAALEIAPEARIALKIDEHDRIRDACSRRRLLMLALKSALRVSESLLERLAALTGYDLEWLYGLVEELKARVQAQRRRAALLIEKRNACYFHIVCLEEQLRLATEEGVRAVLSRQLDRERQRLDALLHDLSHVTLGPSHRDIAEVLGIPKGTVDSAIFYLKESLQALSSR